jgi:hypothetical protein
LSGQELELTPVGLKPFLRSVVGSLSNSH